MTIPEFEGWFSTRSGSRANCSKCVCISDADGRIKKFDSEPDFKRVPRARKQSVTGI